MDMNWPIPEAWQSYVSQLPAGLEVIPGVLYSQKDYVSAATTKLTLFDFVNASREDITNMAIPGQLPNPEAFLIQNIRVYFKQPVMSDDSGTGDSTAIPSGFNNVVQLSQLGILKLKIGNKIYDPWPIWMLPANSFAKGAFASGSDLLADFAQVDGFLYAPLPNIMIGPQQQFLVTLEWPGGAVTLGGSEPAALPIQVLFDGQHSRSIQ